MGGAGGKGASGSAQSFLTGSINGGVNANLTDGSSSLVESCTIIGNSATGPVSGGAGNPGLGGVGGSGGSGGSGFFTGNGGQSGSGGSAGTASGNLTISFGAYGGVYAPLVDVRDSIIALNKADFSPDADTL